MPLRWVPWVGIGLVLVAAGGWFAYRILDVLGMLAFALLLTAGFQPVVRWLDRRGLSHGVSVAICIGSLIGLVALAIGYLVPIAISQAEQLPDYIPVVVKRLGWMQQRWGSLRAKYPTLLPSFADVATFLRAQAGGWFQRSIGFTGALVVLGAEAFTVLVLTFFFLKDGHELLRHLLMLLPPQRRAAVPGILDAIGERVGDWVFGQATLMGIIGVATAIGMWALGVPFAILLGAIAGVLEAVPYVGPVLTAGVCLIVAATVSWKTVLWAVGFFVLLQQAENQLLQPVVVGKAVGLHPVWVILALFIGGTFFGLAGMVLAVPAAATLNVLIDELYLPRIAAQELALFPPSDEADEREAA